MRAGRGGSDVSGVNLTARYHGSLPSTMPRPASLIVRPVAGLVLAYLLAALPFVLLGADGSGRSLAFVAAHVVAMLVMGRAAWREGTGLLRTILDHAPLALIPWMYAELPQLMQGAGAAYSDALVQGWEAALFGTSPAQAMAVMLPWQWVSEPLHLAYFSYYALIYVPPLVLYLQGRRTEFLEMSFAVLGTFAVCFAVFAVFPVQGPRYLWDSAAVPDGPVRGVVLAVLEAGSSRGAAFPSSHVAVAVVQSVLSLRAGLRHGWLVALLTVGLAMGAVYGGFHYAIDALAGGLLGLGAVAVALAVYPRVHPVRAVVAEDRQEVPLPAS